MVTPPLLALAGLEKVWPNGTAALRGVELEVRAGSVHGLLGANGAGKSTLIKVLAGAIPASGGSVIWRGEPARWRNPTDARAGGIATIYQHIPLVPTLSALENMLLDQRRGWRRDRAGRTRAAAVVASLGHPFDLDALVGDLPIGARQMVAIAQGLMSDPALLIMDEPTASLAADERAPVYRTVRPGGRGTGGAVRLALSGRDRRVDRRGDRPACGRAVLHEATATLDEATIAAAIAGRSVVALERAHRQAPVGPPVLRARGLRSAGGLAPVDLDVAGGEIVGVAGMLGAGRSELLHALFGADPATRGEVAIEGAIVARDPEAAVAAGIALVPEDRARQGFVAGLSIAENVALPTSGLMIDAVADRARAAAAIERLAIKADGPDALVGELSGGNAQKVTIAKWLTPRTRVLLLDEPTAGIDIGARTDILRLVRNLADEGLAVMLVSSEFEELLAIADRILVLRDGALVAEADPAAIDEAGLLQLAGGGRGVEPMESRAA